MVCKPTLSCSSLSQAAEQFVLKKNPRMDLVAAIECYHLKNKWFTILSPRLPPDWHCHRSKTYPDEVYFYNVKTKISIWDVAEVMKIAKSEKRVTFSPTVRCQSLTTLESGSISVNRSHEK